MDSKPSNHKEIIALIKRISGQANFIGTPRVYVDMFKGDIVAAVWFNQVVYWDGKNDSPIGFYKTDPEWKEELGLSPFQSRRSRALCTKRGLITTKFKKAYGTPKYHYLVNWDKLLEVLKPVLEASDLQQSKRSELQQSKRSDLQESSTSLDLEESRTSLSENQTPSENEEEGGLRINLTPSALLEDLDLVFEESSFGRLEIRPSYLERSPGFILGYISKAFQDSKRLRDPIAFLASRLAGDKDPSPRYLERFREILPEKYLEKLGLALYLCSECKAEFKFRDELSSHWESEHFAEVEQGDGKVVAPEPISEEASQIWKRILEYLEKEYSRSSFSSWIEPTKGIGIESGILRVWTPSEYSRDWLSERVSRTVDRALPGLIPDRDLSVEFFTGS